MFRSPAFLFCSRLPSRSLVRSARSFVQQRSTFSQLSRLAATMSQSHACCTVPPVISHGYKEKGEYITVQGMKTYTTGPKDAKKAILVLFDIFGQVLPAQLQRRFSNKL